MRQHYRVLGASSLMLLTAAGCSAEGGGGEATGTTASASTVCGQTSVKGIDVYHGDNGGAAIDWTKVKAGGASFAFAKATQSTNFIDPMFSKNWSGMKAAGLVRGAYHFFDPATDPTAQAKYFLATVGSVSPGDLLVLDFETANGESDATLAAAANTFLSAVKKSTGLTPFLYTSPDFLSSYGSLGAYPLWVANYGVSCPDVPSAWKTYTFWQSSGSGSAAGISGQCDVDTFNGTLAELQELGKGGAKDGGKAGEDAGTRPLADSGSRDEDGGAASGKDSGAIRHDAGRARSDSGKGAMDGEARGDVDSGATTAGDASESSSPGGSSGGCSCTVGERGLPQAPLVSLGAALMALGSIRRRRTRDPRR